MRRAVIVAILVLLAGPLAYMSGRPLGMDGSPAPIGGQRRQDRILESTEARALPPGRKRDIYYLVFDRYAGARTLKNDFDFDNEPFLNFLRRKGFYVADESRTNYPRTSHALAAALNLEFLDYLDEEAGPLDSGPVQRLLRGFKVARFLKARGYRYVKVGSWWPPTESDPFADVTIRFHRAPRSAIDIKAPPPALAFRVKEHLRRKFVFNQLVRNIPKIRGPKFVWVHMLCPHEPWAQDKDGDWVGPATADSRSDKENYVRQVMWVNSQLRRVIRTLLSGPESRRPIVIIQADEGPYAGLQPGNATRANIGKLKQKFYILSAFYFPGTTRSVLHPGITPVNTFRALFNLYFNTDYALLPDRSYVYVFKDLYRFLDVTELVTE